MNREFVEEILTDEGYEVDSVENGLQVVERLQVAPPDYYRLILMDIQMPVMDGNEAARTIRALEDKKRASIPILAVTANAFNEDRKMAKESGMNGFLTKPIRATDMLRTIEEYFG